MQKSEANQVNRPFGGLDMKRSVIGGCAALLAIGGAAVVSSWTFAAAGTPPIPTPPRHEVVTDARTGEPLDLQSSTPKIIRVDVQSGKVISAESR